MSSIILWAIFVKQEYSTQCFLGRQHVYQFSFIIHCVIQEILNCVWWKWCWFGWKLTIYAHQINSIRAWSKNGPQDRSATGGSLGGWGLTRGSFFHGERGRESSRAWLWTKASRIQWYHHNENILSREWTPIYTMTTDMACVPLTWEGALLNTLGWTSRMWPVLLGGQGPPRCWLSEQRPRRMKDVTWMCCKVRLWELKHWSQL